MTNFFEDRPSHVSEARLSSPLLTRSLQLDRTRSPVAPCMVKFSWMCVVPSPKRMAMASVYQRPDLLSWRSRRGVTFRTTGEPIKQIVPSMIFLVITSENDFLRVLDACKLREVMLRIWLDRKTTSGNCFSAPYRQSTFFRGSAAVWMMNFHQIVSPLTSTIGLHADSCVLVAV